ncbi:MAG: radical SAM protein [Elusimicrobiota bacterium]
MVIRGRIIRPPSEAENFLLQVTTGCSSDNCTFCGAYADKPFSIKTYEEIVTDIETGSRMYPGIRRVFLLDGDALAVPNRRLIPVLKKLGESFTGITRISSYVNGYNITNRSDTEIEELYTDKLRLVYIGLESGSQKILDICRKRSGVKEMTDAVIRMKRAGIKSSVIVLLGLGGKEHSEEHVYETVKALNRMQPRYLSLLTVMLIPGTGLWKQARRGDFEELDSTGLLNEAYGIVKGLALEGTVFRSNHASNYLSIEGKLPRDRKSILDKLEKGIYGTIKLRPEYLRGL